MASTWTLATVMQTVIVAKGRVVCLFVCGVLFSSSLSFLHPVLCLFLPISLVPSTRYLDNYFDKICLKIMKEKRKAKQKERERFDAVLSTS